MNVLAVLGKGRGLLNEGYIMDWRCGRNMPIADVVIYSPIADSSLCLGYGFFAL